MASVRRSLRWLAAVTALALAAACGGGDPGGTATDDDAVGGTGGPAEATVQFAGAGETRIAGTLDTPATVSGPVPGVLIVPGIAPADRDGRVASTSTDALYEDLSEAFTGAGLATFRYDRRGAGQSRLEPGQRLSWDDMVTDARNALAFLGQRSEVGGSRLAVVGHEMGGVIALKLAAADPRVKSVVLVSTPGRPLVDVLADGFGAENGPESADAFRASVATLVSTGSLPERSAIRAEHQSLLAPGSEGLLRSVFTLDPVADIPGVTVPVLLTVGAASTTVTTADADRLQQALGGRAEVLTAADAGPTLLKAAASGPATTADADDHHVHGGGAPPVQTTRDATAVQRISQFLTAALRAGGQ